MRIEIHVVDAFTQQPDCGNRAGVVLNADSITESDMQSIASFAGFSETAFVLEATDNDHDLVVRYFTPASEVPICGHATVATHYLRAQKLGLTNVVVLAKTGAGVLPVKIDRHGTRIDMTQGRPEFGDILTDGVRDNLMGSLGMDTTELSANLPIQIVSTGHSKVLIPVDSVQTLNRLAPNMSQLTELSQRIGCNGYFPFTVDRSSTQLRTFGRMFAPAIGVEEDSVTGNANGPAGAYLAHYQQIYFHQKFCYEGHQGQSLGKPGIVFVSLTKASDQTLTVQVGGFAVESASLYFTA